MIWFLKKISNTYKIAIFFHQIRVKFVEYDFKLQKFIILYQKQKFHNSPNIADFLKNITFSPKSP